MSKGIYLDYAASAPVDPRVEAAMKPYFGKIFGNPHSLHWFGQEAERAVFESRRKIADSIGADYKEIIFTGSATEANNLALRGVVKGVRRQASGIKKPRIITTTIEHESVLETCRDLEKEGVEVIYIPVGKDGIVDPRKIKSALNERTVLVSVIHANNEVGTIQPIKEISEIIKVFRVERLAFSERERPKATLDAIPYTPYPIFHTDAVQSFQYLDCGPAELDVDLMTISSHKIYGPKGIGALYIRNSKFQIPNSKQIPNPKSQILKPIITGSGQEFGLRSGTDNVPYIVGFARAVEIADKMRDSEAKRVGALRDYFWKKLQSFDSGNPEDSRNLKINGSLKSRLPNNINIYFPGHTAHDLLIKLDLAGIAVSPGAACTTRVSKESFVLEAMGFPKARASGSLRFSLGRQTTKKEIDHTILVISKIINHS